MNEVFVIEREVALGIWELVSPTFYTDELQALDSCINMNEKMKQLNKNFVARVTKLTISKKED